MARTSKAVYLGNTGNEYCGFTVGKEYDIHNYETGDNYIGAFGDDGGFHHIKNGAFHQFDIREGGEGFVTENEHEVVSSGVDKNPGLRYYINGHEVDKIEFGSVYRTVYELDRDGIKCDTIKFEVKFE